MGHDDELGQAHMHLDGREEVRAVIFQQGGPIDPFFGRPLSPGIQKHILGVSSYMMPFLRAAKHPSVPSAHVREVPGVACLEKNLMVLEWEPPRGQGLHMRLTLWRDELTWLIVALQRYRAGCPEISCPIQWRLRPRTPWGRCCTRSE